MLQERDASCPRQRDALSRSAFRWTALASACAFIAAAPLTSCVTVDSAVRHLIESTQGAVSAVLMESAAGRPPSADVHPSLPASTAQAEENRADDPLPDPGFASLAPGAGGQVDAVRAGTDTEAHLADLVRRGVMEMLFQESSTSRSAIPAERYYVQIGSHHELSAAELQLAAARSRFEALVAGHGMRVQPVDLAQKGRFYRVYIGPFASPTAARGLCATLQDRRQACLPTREIAEAPPAHAPPPERAPARSAAALTVAFADVSDFPGRPAERAVGAQLAEMPVFTAPGLPGVLD